MAALSSRASAPHGNRARKSASVPECTAARQNCQSSSAWIRALQQLLIYTRDCAATWKKRRQSDARNPARRKRRAARRKRRAARSRGTETRTSWRSTVRASPHSREHHIIHHISSYIIDHTSPHIIYHHTSSYITLRVWVRRAEDRARLSVEFKHSDLYWKI